MTSTAENGTVNNNSDNSILPTQGGEKLDWHGSNIHATIISPSAGKGQKLEAYAEWANDYDGDMEKYVYSSPQILARRLFDTLAQEKVTAAPPSQTVRILDAGCGTGLVAPAVKEEGEKRGMKLDIVGLDYSAEMLEHASKKNVYGSLIEADLNERLPFDTESFDAITAGALFVAGHCGPSVLRNMTAVLKVGGIAVMTIRKKTYDEEAESYLQAFVDNKLEVLENVVDHYLGPVQCHYVTVKRVE